MQVREVKALIGFFDLDPNRVYDLVLDAWAAQPGNDAYFGVVQPLFSPEAQSQMLGFKFQQHAGPGNATPPGLFRVAALLVKVGDLVTVSGQWNSLL